MKWLMILLIAISSLSLHADDTKKEIEELKRRLDIMASEIEKIRLGDVAVKADQIMYGLSPAASKIYRVNQGLSIGGYGEIIYQNVDSKKQDGTDSGVKDSTDVLRAILYVGYKIDEKFIINTEFEFEHAGADGGSGFAGAEFAYLDYLHDPRLNIRAGLLLMPMGFVNELHEPTIFHGVNRPDIESKIIPTTWRENGLGIWGDIKNFTYRTYIVNGFKGENFSAKGLRSGRQKGAQASAQDLAWVGRLDYTPAAGALFGVAGYFGGSDQDAERNDVKAKSQTTIFDTHIEYKKNGYELRFLGVIARNTGVRSLNEVKTTPATGNASIGEELKGYYIQLGYDFWQGLNGEAFTPFFRYSQYDTQSKVPAGFSRNPANDVTKSTLGISYKPHQNVIVKADYEQEKTRANTGIDSFNLGLGFNF
jgi:hypothetical protein